MPSFHIRPTDPSFATTELDAIDASGVLGVVERMRCREAHVDQDGIYSFTLKQDDDQVWCVMHSVSEDASPRSSFERKARTKSSPSSSMPDAAVA